MIFHHFLTHTHILLIHIVFLLDMGCCQDLILQATASYLQCIYVTKHRFNATVILHCGRLRGKKKMENTIKETGKVRYALTFAAFEPFKCSQQHHIRSIRYLTSDRA